MTSWTEITEADYLNHFTHKLKGPPHFVPGDVKCCYCGWKSEDAWDESPEGFVWRFFRNEETGGLRTECICDDCDRKNQEIQLREDARTLLIARGE